MTSSKWQESNGGEEIWNCYSGAGKVGGGWKKWEVMQEEKEMRNTLRDVRRNK